MVVIPFPLSSSPGRTPQESAGRVINAYIEALPKAEGQRPIYFRVPGLSRFQEIEGIGHCRGLLQVGSTLLIAHDQQLHAITRLGGSFIVERLGTLEGSELITIAANSAYPVPDIVAVTNTGAFRLFLSRPPEPLGEPNLPHPNSVALYNGYFLYTTGDGKIYASNLDSATVDALSYTQARKRPDGLIRGIAFRDEFFAFGPSSCEVYRDVGAQPFPLAYVTMIPRGIAGRFAVAGFEAGWANELIWVGDDNVIYQLEGYAPKRVSTHSVERAIEALPDKSTLTASVYTFRGHAFWALSSSAWTWEYDLSTGTWHERASYERSRWRASTIARAFDRWIVGDLENSALYEVSESAREHNDPIPITIESDISTGFPAKAGVPRADFWFTTGVGIAPGDDPIQTNPQVSISWSNDGGFSWGNELIRSFGLQAKAEQVVTVRNTGIATRYGRRWRIHSAAPVHFGFMGGDMTVDQRVP